MTIGTLTCNVTIKGKKTASPLHQAAQSAKPELRYRTPAPAKSGQAPASPIETATEDKGPSSSGRAVSPGSVDPQKVADRVYDLIREEIRLGRLRDGGRS